MKECLDGCEFMIQKMSEYFCELYKEKLTDHVDYYTFDILVLRCKKCQEEEEVEIEDENERMVVTS